MVDNTRKKPFRVGNRVYFIKPSGVDVVKIGTSTQPWGRLASLQTSHWENLSIIITIPGGLKKEKKLHKRFSKYRIRGEWFHLSPEIQEYINDNVALSAKGQWK